VNEAYETTLRRVLDAIGTGARAGLTPAEAVQILTDLAWDIEAGNIAEDSWGRRDSRLSEELMSLAIRVLGDLEAVRNWMRAPARALGGVRPLDVCATAEGRRQVETLLLQLEYGVYP
jgi:putative toxin-antitoxin system antitoxin component (TIGR02293 family)